MFFFFFFFFHLFRKLEIIINFDVFCLLSQGDKSRTDDCVRVVVRCRPLNEKEKGQGFKSIAKIDEVRGQVQVVNPNAPRGEPPKTFTFDTVFAPGSKQTDVYNQTARPIVDAVMEGYNGMLWALSVRNFQDRANHDIVILVIKSKQVLNLETVYVALMPQFLSASL